MLVFERWTLTQSSGWSVGLVGLALAVLPGLAAMNASSEAETVAPAELRDDHGDAEPVPDGEPVPEAEAEPVPDGEPVADADADADADDGEPEPEPGLGFGLALDGGGDAGVLLDVLPAAGAVGEAEPDVDEPEGDGDGDVGLEVGGRGVGVLAVGSTSHLVSVFALADVFALAEVLALGDAAPAFTVPARAAPGQPASTPRVRDPPASRLSTAARTCARRIISPCLRCSSRLLCALCGIRRRLGDGWV
jgi:hypothetical protein